MKAVQLNKLLVLSLVLTVAAIGCKKTPVRVTDMSGPGPRYGEVPESSITNIQSTAPITNEGDSGAKTTGGIAEPNPIIFDKYIPHPEILKAYSVYFDYDSSVIKTGEKQKLTSVADYLKGHAGQALRIEGNCDERGTEGYNLALGERRALAAREALADLGVDAKMIQTISNGKDKPVAAGHDESAWRLNRRDDFIVLVPPGAP